MQKFFGYLVWFVTTLFVVYAFCLNTASAVFLDSIKASLHASSFNVSIATGAFILGFACMQIPAGYLLDKFNPKYIVSSGVLLLACGNFITAYSDNILLFSVSNFIQGIGASFAFIASAVLISQWFTTSSFPILFGMTQAISCILAGVIHYYFTIELATYSWQQIYKSMGIFGCSLFVLTLLIVKSPTGYLNKTSISLSTSLTTVLKNRQIWLCSISAATSFGVLLAYAGLWYIQVQDYYAVDHIHAIIIGAMIFCGIGIGTPILGWLSNKLQSRVRVAHGTLCLGTMALLLGLYLPHAALSTHILVHIISFLIGFFLSGSMLFYTMVNEIATDATRGVAISVLNTAVFLFNTIMLFVPYLFITSTSMEFYTYLWILPFFIIFSIFLLYYIKDTYTV